MISAIRRSGIPKMEEFRDGRSPQIVEMQVVAFFSMPTCPMISFQW
jgi:hypothetical protein